MAIALAKALAAEVSRHALRTAESGTNEAGPVGKRVPAETFHTLAAKLAREAVAGSIFLAAPFYNQSVAGGCHFCSEIIQ